MIFPHEILKTRVLFKNPLRTLFLPHQDVALCKNHQNLMCGFLDMLLRTNKHESIGVSG